MAGNGQTARASSWPVSGAGPGAIQRGDGASGATHRLEGVAVGAATTRDASPAAAVLSSGESTDVCLRYPPPGIDRSGFSSSTSKIPS